VARLEEVMDDLSDVLATAQRTSGVQ